MTAIHERGARARRRVEKSASQRRHPASRTAPDGRGPQRPAGRRTPLFLFILLVVMALVALGVVMVLSASAAASLSDAGSAWSLFRRQLLWTAVGTVGMLVMLRIDYHRLRPLARPSLFASFALLALVVFPGVGTTVNGATRWLGAGGLTLQPSEPAKLALILFVADLLSRRSRRITDTRSTLRPVVCVAAAMAFLLMLQPHLGATLIVGTIIVAMLFLAGAPVVTLTGMAGLGGLFAGMLVLSSSWRRDRLLAFLDPWSDPAGVGYQPLQSLHAITVGGLSGVGLGASRAKWGFLPYAHTDFIFAIVAEELGLLGASLVVLGFVALAAAGYTVALRAKDRFGMLLAAGITTWILAQAVLNMGAVMALLPVTGVTLPFLSFGGSSQVVTMAAVGILLNVARQVR